MKKFIATLFITILFCGCEEESIVMPKYCLEEPDFSITHANLTLVTDTTVAADFDVSATGYFSCTNLKVKKYGVLKNINIYGAICKDYNLELYITYNDTVDNSKLKAIASKYNSENYSGYVYYCTNENNICNYTQIGSILGSINSIGISGLFSTPKFFGEFVITTQ